MAKDNYYNFEALSYFEKINTDYRISISDLGSPTTIIAPHGGKIEPKTSDIAAGIARDQFNSYCFEGLKPTGNRSLHLTSHNFDEPQALELLARSQIVVAVHACKDEKAVVYPGGRDEELMEAITKELKAAGIPVVNQHIKYQGLNPANICNRGLSGRGAQLEISRGLRDDNHKVQMLCSAIHTALNNLTVRQKF
jgi:phage replication-related protein YjqB (UPF0714/DUF867 family)